MKNGLKFFALAVLAAALWCTTLRLPFGEPRRTGMDDYFISHVQQDTGANNAVTAIVFDYRGFDTLGEATVLFTAVMGVGLILRRLNRREKEASDETE